MKYHVVYFEPEEWVAFRENTVFETGDSARLSHPKVETFLGAVRTAFLKEKGIDPKDIPEEIVSVIGDSSSTGILRMIGPFFYSGNKHYLPIPANLYELKEETEEAKTDTKKTHELMIPNKKLKYNYNGFDLHLPWIPYSEKVAEQPEAELIEIKSLEALQMGNLDELNLIKFTDIASTETHVGIALENGKKGVQDEMLYSVNTYRFKENSGFFFFINEETKKLLDELDEVFLGMKQRVAKLHFGIMETNLFEFVPTNKSAICLITPSIFDNGFMPSNGIIKDSKVVSAIVKRKMPISGWDLAKNQPKPIYHVVPAGSVYFLDEPIDNDLFNNSISNLFDDFGYGRYFTINWDFLRRDING